MPTRLEHRPAVTAPVILAPEGSRLLFNTLGVAASNVRSPQKDPSTLLRVQLGFKNLKGGEKWFYLISISVCVMVALVSEMGAASGGSPPYR